MRKISNINSKKFTISLLCLLLIDDRWVRLAAEQSENEWSQIAHNHDQSGKRSIPREPFSGIMIRDQNNLFQFQALHNALINRVRLQQRPTGIIGEFDDLLQRGNWVTCLEHGRPIKREKAVLTAGKIMLSVAIILSTAFALTTSAAFANAPGGAYIQCDGSKPSPVRCVPDGW